jgi:hypothetical protein
VDRKNKFSHVQELVFPAPGNQGLLHETVVDGELVTDMEADGQQLVRYLAFDLLATNGQSIIDKPLGSRLAVRIGYFSLLSLFWSAVFFRKNKKTNKR